MKYRDSSLGYGVYFTSEDYIGFGPRLVIFVIDSAVLLALLMVFTAAWHLTVADHPAIYAILCVAIIWGYLVPLKRSSMSTLGYRLMRVRITTLYGAPPSLLTLTYRELFWLFGPNNFVFDFLWCGIDVDRQTLRDRFSGTCVVKRRAVPTGTGAVHLFHYWALGYAFALPHVTHPVMQPEGGTA